MRRPTYSPDIPRSGKSVGSLPPFDETRRQPLHPGTAVPRLAILLGVIGFSLAWWLAWWFASPLLRK